MTTQSIRDQFEDWCLKNGYSTVKMKDDANVYGARTTEDMWRGWQGAMSEFRASFRIGTVVTLRGGGASMTVIGSAPDGDIVCNWFDANKALQSGKFPEQSLAAFEAYKPSKKQRRHFNSCQCKSQKEMIFGYDVQVWQDEKWEPLLIAGDNILAVGCCEKYSNVLIRCRGCGADMIRETPTE